jgi:hypothetical protein
MRDSSQPDSTTTSSRVRAGLSLFLVVLFFYNPFFTVYGSPAGLSVQHPLSFRGTVASSELSCTILKQATPRIDAPEEAVLEVVRLAEVSVIDAERTQEDPLISAKETESEDLWVRPPPVL